MDDSGEYSLGSSPAAHDRESGVIEDVHWCQEDNSSENDDSDTLLMAAHLVIG